MVDVSSKDVTVREALASGDVTMSPSTGEMIRLGTAKKRKWSFSFADFRSGKHSMRESFKEAFF